MSKETLFAPESRQVYYFVRESFGNSEGSEGYADKVELESELIDGEICVDGQTKENVGYGDTVEVDFHPKYSLRCLKF